MGHTWGEEPLLRGGGGLRDVVICDELFDVRKLLVKIFTVFLLLPVAWELLQGADREEC